MKILYADHFINAFSSVLSCFPLDQFTYADIQMPAAGRHTGGLAVMIEMNGDLRGHVYMSMDAKTGQELASLMLGGMDVSETNELVTGTVCELCNMVMGNACSNISAENKIVDITPPIVIEDQQGAVPPENSYTIPVVLEGLGTIELDVAL